MSATITARELRNRIAAKYGREQPWDGAVVTPRHIVLFEVPLFGRIQPQYRALADTGFAWIRSRQRIDAVAIGMWNSTEGRVHGFEIKVSRADLLAELRDLTKSEHCVRAVDRWWLVLAPGIRRDTDPIPESWGIIEPHGRGLRVVREAGVQPGEVRALLSGVALRALTTPRYLWSIAFRRGWEAGYAAAGGRR